MFTEQQKRKIEKNEGYLMARVKLPDVNDRICDYCNQPLTGEVYAFVIYWPLHPQFKNRFIPPKKRWYIKELYCLPCGKKLARKHNDLLIDHIIPDLQKYLEHYLSGNLESYFLGKE